MALVIKYDGQAFALSPIAKKPLATTMAFHHREDKSLFKVYREYLFFKFEGRWIIVGLELEEYKRDFIMSQVTFRKGREDQAYYQIKEMEGEELNDLYLECLKEFRKEQLYNSRSSE